MALRIVNADTFATSFGLNLGTLDDAYVRVGRIVGSTESAGIRGNGSNHLVTVSGEVMGIHGIQLGASSTAAGNAVMVNLGGIVSANSGVGVNVQGGNARLTNLGQITSGNIGAVVSGDAAQLINYGTIAGHIGAQYSSVSSLVSQRATLENHGTISGTSRAIDGNFNGDFLKNYGTITGKILMFGGDDIVLNRGRISGSVDLGEGNDVIDNRGGVVTGTVSGLGGSDVFRPGAGSEVFDGGLGIDTLDFRGTFAVQVALDGSIDGTANADDDSYTGFENLFGTAYGDVLIGDTGLNRLQGFGGKDTLAGGAGGDVLQGGNGADQLSGGAGSDQFLFLTTAEAGDTITDFGNATGNQDFIMVAVNGFGGGLVKAPLAASQFQSRADNLAQDSDDRFIFRTTDKTLWFDVDGNGVEGPILLADLQASATLTAANIVLV